MRIRRPRTAVPLLLALTLGLAALLPAGAHGAQSPVLKDCSLHLELTRHYSIAQLQYALNNLPPSMSEYSDCADVVRKQLDLQLGKGGSALGGGSGGSSFLPAWLIVVLGVLVLGGVGATVAARRRR